MARFDRSDLIAVIALLISALGTVVAFRETSILREQQEMALRQQAAEAWPYLDLGQWFDTRDSLYHFEMELTNVGTGPALMNAVVYTLDGDTIHPGRVAELLSQRSGTSGWEQRGSVTFEHAIRPSGSRTRLFGVVADPRQVSFQTFQEQLLAVRVDYCYCSIHQRCWRFVEDRWATPDEACPVEVGL